MSALPNPVRLPRAVQTLWYGIEPYSFFDAGRRRHGDIFTVRIAGETWTMLADPDAVREVFTGDPDVLYSGEANRDLRAIVGTRNVLLMDGAEHLRRRKLLLPPFHGERMQAYREIVVAATERELAEWPTGRATAALPHTQSITFEVIMRAVFGLDDAARLGPLGTRLRALLDWAQSTRTMLRFALRGPAGLTTYAPLLRMIARLDEEVFAEIAQRRAAADLDQRDDILSLLLLARDEAGEPLPDQDIRDELLTLLTAGHETTAAVLAWALHYLARDEAAWERLAAGEPGFAEAVVQETLRIRPAVPLVVRLLKAPLTVAGHDLPAGAVVAPSSVLIQRDPRLYPEPHAFRPDRFVGTKPGTYTSIPFGGGVRRCIGGAFAQFEASVVLTEIAKRRTLQPYRRRPERIGRRGIVLIPHRGGRVILSER